jgi:hypothetical protein
MGRLWQTKRREGSAPIFCPVTKGNMTDFVVNCPRRNDERFKAHINFCICQLIDKSRTQYTAGSQHCCLHGKCDQCALIAADAIKNFAQVTRKHRFFGVGPT